MICSCEVRNHCVTLICIRRGESLVGVFCIGQSSRGGYALCVKSLGDSTQINILLMSLHCQAALGSHKHFGICHTGLPGQIFGLVFCNCPSRRYTMIPQIEEGWVFSSAELIITRSLAFGGNFSS